MKRTIVLCFLLSVFLVLAGSTSYAEVLIITNKNVSMNILNKEELKKIFLGKTIKWPNNIRICFVTRQGDIHKEFLKKYISRSSSQYKNYWRKMVFTGKGRKPKAFGTDEELIQFVAETEGAIGYINKDTAAANVKTITVN